MTNSCYRTYTDKNKIARVAKKKDFVNQKTCAAHDTDEVPQKTGRFTRSMIKSDSNILIKEKNSICVICGFCYNDSNAKKYKICEIHRATNFLKIIRFYQDEVFTRCSHLQDPKDIFAADIYYHSNCLRAYEQKYIRDTSCRSTIEKERTENNEEQSFSNKADVIAYAINSFMPRIRSGEILTLSAVRDETNSLKKTKSEITNRDVKNYLTEHFSNSIEFSVPSDKKKPTLFYDSSVSLDTVIDALKPHNLLKNSAYIIKNSLNKCAFNLEDKFLDEINLRTAWENSQIPDELQIFFQEMFSIRKRRVISSENLDKEISIQKHLKIKSLFQIMFYILRNGEVKTPLHTMIGMSVYNTCKSKSLIQSLNHLGLSISYDEVLRCKTSLALYTIESCTEEVPLPSHFEKDKFTKGAFDNFDHNEATQSGLHSTHDTVSVLFQESSEVKLYKPNISCTSINKKNRSLPENLQCQKLKNFYKPNVNITLTQDYSITDFSLTSSDYEILSKEDLAYNICRMEISNQSLSLESEKQTTPPWTAFNSILIEDTREIQRVGFLPILPYPVTEYSSVYTAMNNFKNILKQLNQKYFPLFCDQGVYRIARETQLHREDEFKDFTLMLGSFHMAKIVCACIGNYLKDSGVDHIFIETESFGVSVVQQILNGSHYSRSVKGYFLLGEALLRLQLQAFLENTNSNNYNDELITLKMVQDLLAENNTEESKVIYKDFCTKNSQILMDFRSFVIKRSEQSPLFKYWSNVLTLIQLLRDIIRADRQGNWILHKNTVKKLLPIFMLFDRTNYVRSYSLYVQDIFVLEEKKPELYREFLKGNFSVKRSHVPFTSVATDQGLEQTINLHGKSSSGFIG